MRAVLAVAFALIGTPVLADPCEAIPKKGPAPPEYVRRGAVFSGPVVYVGDGDGLCVKVGPRKGLDWVEVRLADFYAPELDEPGGREAKSALERVAMGRHAQCVAEGKSWDRSVARCAIGDVSIGDLLRGAGVEEGGRGR